MRTLSRALRKKEYTFARIVGSHNPLVVLRSATKTSGGGGLKALCRDSFSTPWSFRFLSVRGKQVLVIPSLGEEKARMRCLSESNKVIHLTPTPLLKGEGANELFSFQRGESKRGPKSAISRWGYINLQSFLTPPLNPLPQGEGKVGAYD